MASDFKCPRTLRADVKMAWKKGMPVLKELNVPVLQGDQTLLVLFFSAQVEERELTDLLEKEGRTTVNPHSGLVKNHPLFEQLQKTRKALLEYAIQLGLTPKARKEFNKKVEEPEEVHDFK